ncbi:MAG TPA: TonB-dependent receptor [Terracidiphilus sp.]
MKKFLKGWMLLGILSTAVLAFGQNATTSLRGVVKDPNGALVPGAKITLTDKADGQTLSAVANSAGEYVFAQVPPARYTITATAAGFGDQVETAELLVNQPATIDFTLSIQSSTVTVDVSATAQTLNTTDASLGNSADNALIQALPSETRNVPDLLSLQPGVLYLPPTMTDSRSGSVNGGRSDQGNVTVDGVDDNDQVGGFAFTGVLRETQDSIEEFRVTTGDANADSGRSSGAQISMVTKSGTNKFHGAAYEYNRPTITVANDWFNKNAEADSGEPNIPGKLIRNIFGGAVGGRIVKDKLFFFGNYEGERLAENTQVTETVPTASYQQGNINYPDANNNTQIITASQLAVLDAGCQICGTAAYPNKPGPNPNVLKYFNSMPAANGFSEGDGYTSGSFSFSSPNPISQNTSIARLDYVPNDRHRVFVRGNLQKDVGSELPAMNSAIQFPGQPPAHLNEDNSKGITGGDTWMIRSNLTNDVRYGFVRQGYSTRGIASGDYVDFRFLSTNTAETRSAITSIPVNNIVDNFTWTKGNHSIQVGGNWRLIHQNHSTDQNSYNGATSNPYWLGGNPPTPDEVGEPALSGGFSNSYEIAYANLVGTIPQITDIFNYKLTSPTTGTALAEGSFIDRHFKANEFEWYAQDAWRAQPNLTITFGVRHTILQTPYETSGQQVTPTVDTHAWYLAREAAAQTGQISEPDLQFAPAGPFYNKPGFWPKSKDNFAPRLAVAYSPDGKTSIRVGAGIYYDHYGEALINTFDQNGSFGMSSQISNPAGVYGIEGDSKHLPSPRFIDNRTLPPINVGTAPTNATFPYTAPLDSFSISWGLDSKIKTPYSETFDFSVQRELPAGFTLETAYVGRLGRHLLQQLDLAEPVDYVDPQGGGDYFAAGSRLSHLVDLNGGADETNGSLDSPSVPAIPYFEDVFPFMAGIDYPGESATQAIYNNEWAPYRSQYGATTSLSDIDFYCSYGCPPGYQSKFWQDQFSSLYALSSMGMSYYNSGQVTLRHPSSHGFQMDVSYTYSHSIDMGSDTERSTEEGGSDSNTGAFSEIINTWQPYRNRGNSDFDTRHLLTVDGVYQLPFGRGKMLLGSANRLLDAFAGGWQLSGINRWTSGLPFSFFEPGWTTNWQEESYGVVTAPIKMRRHFDQNGDPQFFDNPNAINNGIATGTPVRLPYPGEAGERNNFRGDGYFDIDSGLAKTWKLGEIGSLKFAWEVYNVTNTVRFDPASIGSGLTDGNLGVASSLLTQPRRMQFSLRYDF